VNISRGVLGYSGEPAQSLNRAVPLIVPQALNIQARKTQRGRQNQDSEEKNRDKVSSL